MWSIIIILLIIVLVLLAYLDTRKPRHFPPGPVWLPILGCAWELRRLHKEKGSLPEATQALATKYGPVVGARVGRERVVFVYGWKAIDELLSRDELNGRPDNVATTSRTGGKRRGVLFTDSECLQEQKRFVFRHFNEATFRKVVMREMIKEKVGSIIDDVTRAIEKDPVVDMYCFFRIHVLSAFCLLITGQTGNQQELSELEAIVADFARNVPLAGPVFGMFPFLRHICPEYCGYNVELLRDAAPNRGFIHAYLDKLNSAQSGGSFSQEQLLAICLDLVTAGYDSICSTLKFTFLYLILNPDIQKKAQEEIDTVLQGRPPTIEEKPHLPYVEGIVLESLRMFTGRSHFVPRRATKDTQFNGYFIRKNTTLLLNHRGTLMDEAAGWQNPDDFDPGRFLRDGRAKIPNNFSPFGLGKRRCVGEVFARESIFLVVAGLLQAFKFETVPGNPTTVETVENFAPSCQTYKTYVTLR
ncbi:probable cytochrome P450 303a1 isoform X2 [Photinus pyralis]|uniref:probable cytochrome P450 303a1 isoform X2 n=1 Tax=Photinus pyralis TaxID=7054 RepID=UPI0012676482|nr:probable cytochrome P450 303a1 isoform X2 [Photinus pyralis]